MDEPAEQTFEYVIAIGSNIGDRMQHLDNAIASISSQIGRITFKAAIIETKAIGNADQEFLNSAVLVRTHLEPEAVLKLLLEIELANGRKRTIHWGNRTLDLDIIIAWHLNKFIRCSTPSLTLPHPEAFNREFVMKPLSEILAYKAPLISSRHKFS